MAGLVRLHVLGDADQVVDAHDAKDGKDDNLENDTGNNRSVARLLEVAVGAARRCGDAATDGLDDEAREIAGEEDARVPDGADAGCRRR